METETRHQLSEHQLMLILSSEAEGGGIFSQMFSLFETFGWTQGAIANGVHLKVSKFVWALMCNEIALRAETASPGLGLTVRLGYMNKGPSSHDEDDKYLVIVEPGFVTCEVA